MAGHGAGSGASAITPWGLALLRTLKSVEPVAASEQSAFDAWLSPTQARDEAVIEATLLVLTALNQPYQQDIGCLQPIAMQRTPAIIVEARSALGIDDLLPCDTDGYPVCPLLRFPPAAHRAWVDTVAASKREHPVHRMLLVSSPRRASNLANAQSQVDIALFTHLGRRTCMRMTRSRRAISGAPATSSSRRPGRGSALIRSTTLGAILAVRDPGMHGGRETASVGAGRHGRGVPRRRTAGDQWRIGGGLVRGRTVLRRRQHQGSPSPPLDRDLPDQSVDLTGHGLTGTSAASSSASRTYPTGVVCRT